MWQGVHSGQWREQGDPAHAACPGPECEASWDPRDTVSFALAALATVLLLTLFAVPARAQGSSGLRIAARVIATAPSREALAAALNPGVVAASQPLAQIHHLVEPDPPDSVGRARRPRTIITIGFLRN